MAAKARLSRREHREVLRLRLRLRRVVCPSWVEERRRAVCLRLEGRIEVGEFPLELLHQDLRALVEAHELALRGLHRRLERALDHLDRLHDLLQRRLGHAALAIKDAGHLIVDLEGLMLESIQALGVVIRGLCEVFPRHAVELVLPAEVAHESTEGLHLHRASRVLLLHDLGNLSALCGR